MSDGVLVDLAASAVMGFGALFVVHGRRMRQKVDRLRQVGQRTSAVVVSYEYKRDADGESTRYPMVQFHTADGHLVTAHTDFGGDHGGRAPGLPRRRRRYVTAARPEVVATRRGRP